MQRSFDNGVIFHRLVSECQNDTGLPRAQAERAVARKFPHFAPAPAQSVAGSGESAERELDRRARDLAARERVTYATAYTRILNSDPHLYLAYLKEHEAALGNRRG